MPDPITTDKVLEIYDGNNSSVTEYPITFQWADNDDLHLLVGGIETGAFTVTPTGFTTAAPVLAGTELILYRTTPRTQILPFPNNATPSPADVKSAVNKLTLMVQEIAAGRDTPVKSLTFPVGEPDANDTALPDAADRLAKVIYFNDTTGELQLLTVAELALTTVASFEALVESKADVSYVDESLTFKQDLPQVKVANFTAANDSTNVTTATATVADPLPVEGKGYTVFVRAGTTTINAVAYTAGTIIRRIYQSATWVSYVYSVKNDVSINSSLTSVLTLTSQAISAVDAGSDALVFWDDSANALKHLTLGAGLSIAGTVLAATGITLGAAVASTSGTSFNFTSIPSSIKRITVILSGVSTNGSSNLLIQIGSGSIVTTGYSSAATIVGGTTATSASATNGFLITAGDAPTYLKSGMITIANISGNTWVSSGTLGLSIAGTFISGGNLTLGGVLDRISITTVNGTDTFDAGTINISYE